MWETRRLWNNSITFIVDLHLCILALAGVVLKKVFDDFFLRCHNFFPGPLMGKSGAIFSCLAFSWVVAISGQVDSGDCILLQDFASGQIQKFVSQVPLKIL